MTDQDDDLPFGLYERLVTIGLKSRLLRFDPTSTRIVHEELDPAESHATFARYLQTLVARALKSVPSGERIARQTEIANALVQLLERAVEGESAELGNDDIASPPQELRSIQSLVGQFTDS